MAERGRENPTRCLLHVVGAHRHRRTDPGATIEAVDTQRSAPTARHVRGFVREGDVLRRPIAGWPGQEPTAANVVDGELEAIAGADPQVTSIRSESDVMGEKRRPKAAYEPRLCDLRNVHDRNLLSLRAERDRERPPGPVDRHVPRARSHHGAAEHATLDDIKG